MTELWMTDEYSRDDLINISPRDPGRNMKFRLRTGDETVS